MKPRIATEMPSIGGYFELELREGEHYHTQALKLNTARNCLEYLLRAKQYKKIYIPHYTCEVMLEPFNKTGAMYQCYQIDRNFDPIETFELKDDEAFLYTNYYGLKQKRVEQLAKIYGNRLIIDNAQAFFSKPVEGISTFYSARKFFGVPDGAYLYTDTRLKQEIAFDQSYDRMQHLLKRIDCSAEEGYAEFRAAENSLCGRPILQMSALTDRILRSIDYQHAAKKRRENYRLLQEAFPEYVAFPLGNHDVPLAFPLRTNDPMLRDRLIAQKIYIACYWPNILTTCRSGSVEYELAEKCLPLPLTDISYIDRVKKVLNQ